MPTESTEPVIAFNGALRQGLRLDRKNGLSYKKMAEKWGITPAQAKKYSGK